MHGPALHTGEGGEFKVETRQRRHVREVEIEHPQDPAEKGSDRGQEEVDGFVDYGKDRAQELLDEARNTFEDTFGTEAVPFHRNDSGDVRHTDIVAAAAATDTAPPAAPAVVAAARHTNPMARMSRLEAHIGNTEAMQLPQHEVDAAEHSADLVQPAQDSLQGIQVRQIH